MIHAAHRGEERYGIKNIYKLETAIRVILSNKQDDKYINLGDSRYIFNIDGKEYCVVYQRKSQTLVTFLPPKSLGTLKNPDYSIASGKLKDKYQEYLKLSSKLAHAKRQLVEWETAFEKLKPGAEAYEYYAALELSRKFDLVESILLVACYRQLYSKHQCKRGQIKDQKLVILNLVDEQTAVGLELRKLAY